MGSANYISGFFTGFGYFFRGMKFWLTHPGLWTYSLLACLLSLIVFVMVLGSAISVGKRRVAPVIAKAQKWQPPKRMKEKTANSLRRLVIFLAVCLTVIVVAVPSLLLYYILQNIINSWFYKRLSRQVEKIVLGKVIAGKKQGFFQAIFQSIADLFSSLGDLLKVALLFLLLNLIPILGQLASLILLAYRSAKSYLNYVLERRDLNYKQIKSKLRAKFGMVVGFGFACLLAMLIPILNPITIVAGTLLAIEHIDKR